MGEENTVLLFPTMAFGLVLWILLQVALWKMFTKAGKPGGASLIPYYNMYVILKMVGKPGWWLLLYVIPLVNLIIMFVVAVALAKAFNKGTLFGVLAPIGYIILGFGKAVYAGTQPAPSTPTLTPPSTV
jgi:hypothetical protein